ncbi:ActS/PrrB/RegB family redox-sensitive histidine kinase [Aestuariispira ectoiniformans]|uniref:ActS/PrrB/RegB family redox-sensitive histidine kinase n=1 Tax=Aestuariispira ectoiniformans TaxID=2775080 RepID=UPI00223B637F|nr:ActS/PrrB/RegB family redox-sensitive histidine kinase [Aestuariispira ectoiniformans]
MLAPIKRLFPKSTAVTRRKGGGILPQTLVLVRWIAVAGQLAAILSVEYLLDFRLPILECLLAILLLAGSNILLGMGYPRRERLTDYHAARVLAFDLAQLTALIYLTGGLENPFTLLILVPVTVSATMLSRGATIMLTILALFAVTFLAFYQRPLPWMIGGLELPLIYVSGLWTALAVAIVFTTIYLWSLTEESRRTAEALAEAESALNRQQKLSALGGLAAAAAHELGSPLATIAVVAKELQSEVPAGSPIAEDIALLLSQSDRCREILAGLTQRPETSGGAPFEQTLLTNLVSDAANNYQTKRIEIDLNLDPASRGGEPEVPRKPEILQGLGNIVQNAGQFAATKITILLYWDENTVRVTVHDDGPGFPRQVLDSIGEPYISTRAGSGNHMGLGIFIAKTLLERVRARVRFRNRPVPKHGAEVEVTWRRRDLEPTV